MSRRTIAIIIAVLFALLVIVVIILAIINSRQDKSQAYLEDAVEIIVDKDTGEQVIVEDPNLVDEEHENPGIVVFGLEQLTEEGFHPVYIEFVKEHLTKYVEVRQGGKYETVTLRPQDFKKSGKTYTSTLRLGQTDEIVPISITLDDFNGTARLLVSDPEGKFGGAYDTGTVSFSGD